MKRIIIITTALFLAMSSMAQPAATPTGSVQSVPGTIEMPVIQSIKVDLMDASRLKFETREDIENGLIKLGYYRLTIVSNVPWVISVMANENYVNAGAGTNTKAPVSMFEVRGPNGVFLPLTTQPQTLLSAPNNLIRNTIDLDVRIKPSIMTQGGNYSAPVIFTISAQ